MKISGMKSWLFVASALSLTAAGHEAFRIAGDAHFSLYRWGTLVVFTIISYLLLKGGTRTKKLRFRCFRVPG